MNSEFITILTFVMGIGFLLGLLEFLLMRKSRQAGLVIPILVTLVAILGGYLLMIVAILLFGEFFILDGILRARDREKNEQTKMKIEDLN